VAAFQWRAYRLARDIDDQFSLASATRPDKLKLILALARGRRNVAELGTATAWTTISLLLADPGRRVVTFDPIEHPARERYLSLVPRDVRGRVRFVATPGVEVPSDAADIDFLYVDSSHGRDATVAELTAWRPRLAPHAVVVLDDFDHPDYPGVREAVQALGLSGEQRHGLFIVRGADLAAPRPGARPSAQP
jgi:predicted O-methyltransferase YrrM